MPHTSATPDRSNALRLTLGALVAALLGVALGIVVAVHVRLPKPTVTETGTRVTTTRLNLRTGPTTSAQALGVLDPGAELAVLERTGDWFHVTYRGQAGFVHSAYVALPPANPNQRPTEKDRAR